jgi:tetraacyldisaccharide 4'-kinase
MLYAKTLPNATVIVSENREKAILKAKELGAKIIFLDDGYSKHNIFKYDILIRPKDEPKNLFCLPSGGYKDTPMMYSFCDCVLKDGDDFKREVSFKLNNIIVDTLPKKIVLLTAISKAYRLFEYLPKDIKTVIYKDHHTFTQKNIDDLTVLYPKYHIVTTAKDMVKLEQLNIKNIYLMELTIKLNDNIYTKVNKYIQDLKQSTK